MLSKFTLGDLLAEMSELLVRHLLMLLGLLFATTLCYSLLELASEIVSMIVGVLADIFIGYLVLERMLTDRIAPGVTGRHLGSMFGVTFLSGAGIIPGLVLFIVPGLYLAARWTLAPAYVVTEHRRTTDSLRASWSVTQGFVIPLMLLYFFGLVVTIGSGGLIMLAPAEAGIAASNVVEVVLTNLIGGGFTIGGWLAGAAAFRLALSPSAEIEAVFG